MTDLLPEDKLPPGWNDEVRLNVLFAPFRSRSVNPKDWDTKMQFWKNLTLVYCTHHKKYSFTLPELTKIFTKNGRPPACLNVVVDDMSRCGELKPVGEFLAKPAETWGSWATDVLVRRPVVWSLKKLRDTVATASDSNVAYVYVSAVERNAAEVCADLSERLSARTVELRELTRVLGVRNDENFQYVLHYLNCQKMVAVKDVYAGKDVVTLVKLCDAKDCDITESDIDFYMLEVSEKALVRTIDRLEEETNKLVKEIKNYLLAGRKQLAKTSLRKKHELDRTIEKRADSLHNIQILLSRLKDADADGQVLASYKKALAGLRRTFKETGLNEDSVAETMVDLEDMIDLQKDIQGAMVFQADVANDRELEEELEDLLTEEVAEKRSNDTSTDIENLEGDLRDMRLVTPPSATPTPFEVVAPQTAPKENLNTETGN